MVALAQRHPIPQRPRKVLEASLRSAIFGEMRVPHLGSTAAKAAMGVEVARAVMAVTAGTEAMPVTSSSSMYLADHTLISRWTATMLFRGARAVPRDSVAPEEESAAVVGAVRDWFRASAETK